MARDDRLPRKSENVRSVRGLNWSAIGGHKLRGELEGLFGGSTNGGSINGGKLTEGLYGENNWFEI